MRITSWTPYQVPVNSQGNPWVEYHLIVPRDTLCSPPPSTLRGTVVGSIIVLKELVRNNGVRARTTFTMLQATNSILVCFLCCTGNMFGPHFWPHEIFPKLSDLAGQLFFFFSWNSPFFLTIVFLTSWHFSLTILLSSLEHSLHDRRYRRFAVGVSDFGVGAR